MMATSPPPPPEAGRKLASSGRRRRSHHHHQAAPHRRRSPSPPRRSLRPRRAAAASSRPLVDDFFPFPSSPSSSPSRCRRGPSPPAPDEEGEEEAGSASASASERRRRKLKLVVKLSQIPPDRPRRPPPPPDSDASSYAAGEDEEDEEEVVDGEEEEEQIKPPKKRRIESCGGGERSGRRESGKSDGSATRSKRLAASGMARTTPLPDRKALEMILDRLQKKDTYSVFAEPVDPEELPDYHDVIEHPMDFGTVRRKLARNAYRSFEQFEDDVFLICSNAMQYNAPDTIYFRQAHSIQELARKKFQELRDEGISTENEMKREQKVRPDSYQREPVKKPISRNSEDNLGFFSPREQVKKSISRNSEDDLGLSSHKEIVKKPVSRNTEDDLAFSSHKKQVKKPISRISEADLGFSSHNEQVKKPFPRNSEDDLVFKSHKEQVKKPHKEHVRKPICRNGEGGLGFSSHKELVKKPVCRNREDVLDNSRHKELAEKPSCRDAQDDLGYSCNKEAFEKPICTNGLEAPGSDISAATVASAGDGSNGLSTSQPNAAETPVCAGVGVFLDKDDSSPLDEIKSEEPDELSARDYPGKPIYKPIVVDETRRTTYNLYEEQPPSECDQIFDVFAVEPKHLIAIGVDAEYSYARSLARFAASLGPRGWKIASERIKEALPPETKFGRGWVGEYEPLLTPILAVDKQSQKQLVHKTDRQNTASLATPREAERPKTAENGNPKDRSLGVHSRVTTGNTVGVSGSLEIPEYKPRLFGVAAEPPHSNSDGRFLQGSQKATASVAKTKGAPNEQMRKSSSSSSSNRPVERAPQRPDCSRVATSGVLDATSTNKMSGQPKHFFQPPEAVAPQPRNEATWVYHGRPGDAKVAGNSDRSRPNSNLGFVAKNQPANGGSFAVHGSGQRNINEQSKLVGSTSAMLGQADKTNKGPDAPRNLFSPFPAGVRENHNIQATPAAQSWISFGAASESKPSVVSPGYLDSSSGWRMPFANVRACDDPKTRVVPQFFRQPVQVGTRENPAQNRGLVIFPQLVPTDFSRSQGQPQWQGLSPHVQQKTTKDTLRPDLNIGFPSPGSPPARQSSGINLEAQQPDLALQL